MRKTQTLIRYVLPIVSTTAITAGILTPICLTLKNQSNKIINTTVDVNDNISSVVVSNVNPNIFYYATEDLFLPTYSQTVMDHFGRKVTYTEGDSTYSIEWPQLIATTSGTIDDNDLITFKELFPNDEIAGAIASYAGHCSADDTVLYLDKDGNLQNHLADSDFQWITLSNILKTAEHCPDATTTDPTKNMVAIFMNPFLYSINGNLTYNGYTTDATYDTKLSYASSYQNILEIDLSNNDLITLPNGIFYQISFANGFELDLANNSFAKLDPSEICNTTWTNIDSATIDVTHTFLSNNNFGKVAKTGWNIGSLTFIIANCSDYGLTASTSLIASQILQHVTENNSKSYWPSNLVKTTFDNIDPQFNNQKILFNAEVWYYLGYIGLVTGVIDNAIDNTYTINLINPKDNDSNGTITLNASVNSIPVNSATSVETGEFTISGFNESTSGLILEIIFMLVFVFVLYFAVRRIHNRNCRPLSKEEKQSLKLKKEKYKDKNSNNSK